jgi:hypothetical protein
VAVGFSLWGGRNMASARNEILSSISVNRHHNFEPEEAVFASAVQEGKGDDDFIV